jgi:hypothetical protein
MEQIILQLNEALVIQPGEVLKPSGTEPLRISYGEYVPTETEQSDSVLAKHLKWMQEKIRKQRGVQITYRRKQQTVNFIAVPTKTNFVIDQSQQYRTKKVDKEYIVESALLILNGALIKPKPGDRITEGTLEYETVEGSDRQCYRPVDPTETYIRIFVQKV